MTKIVINSIHSGFSISRKAVLRLRELGHPAALEETLIGEPRKDDPGRTRAGFENFYLSHQNIDRDDPLLVQVVEELGAEASGSQARLEIVEIPDGVDWAIGEHDGLEWIIEMGKIG